ncbi:MAG: exopolysaccharide biosynthesis protein, partial [Chloroflexi bacterium]|nr:exopolysaccharide biosynthesis protein [Chloroflexota bacterium]
MSAPELVVFSRPASEAAEQFRRLRTNVQFAEVDRPLHTVSVVAAHSHSGKSAIAANLAAAFGQAG